MIPQTEHSISDEVLLGLNTDEGLHCNYRTMLLSVEAAHCFWFCYSRDLFCLGTLLIPRSSYGILLILLPANKAL